MADDSTNQVGQLLGITPGGTPPRKPKTPGPKPKPPPSKAASAPVVHNVGFGMMTDAQGREITHPTAAQRQAAAKQTAAATAPIMGPLSEALGYGNSATTLLGAGWKDYVEGRSPDPLSGIEGGDTPFIFPKNYKEPETAVNHAYRLLAQGKSQEAANLYFPTSPNVMRATAQSGIPGISDYAAAIYYHPKVNAAIDATARMVDPGGAGAGAAADVTGGLLRGGTRVAARAAARGIEKAAPTWAAGRGAGLTEFVKYFEHGAAMRRFYAVRGAAEDLARKAGKSFKDADEAGQRAEMAARNIANAPEYGRAAGANAAQDIFGDLDKADQFEVVHLHEGTSDIDPSNRSPSNPLNDLERARYERLKPAVDKWRAYGAQLDDLTRQWLGDDSRLLPSSRYFPRVGFAKDAGHDPLSDGEEAILDNARSQGGVTVRKGTLGEDIHRKYATLKQAMAEASATGRFDINPDWTPKDALENHIANRQQAYRIYEQMRELENVGLVQPQWKTPPTFSKLWVPTKAALRMPAAYQKGLPVPGVPPEMQRALSGQLSRERQLSASLTRRKLLKGVQMTPELNRLLSVGTMAPAVKSIKRMTSPGVMSVRQEGFLPFTKFGDIRTFGLPLARQSYIHPTIHSMLLETRGRTADPSTGMVGAAGDLLQAVNRAAAQWQVSFAPYHVGINLRANVASALRSPQEWATFMTNLFNPEARAYAKATGAYRPYTEPEIIKELPGVMGKGLQLFHKIAARPLYRDVEPRIAGALQKALEPRMGRAGAALETRNTLGEPENIPRNARDMAQMLEFPAWFLSQMRRWTTMPFRRPNQYNAAQAGITDWNAAMGRSRQPGDQNRMFPPIMLGYTDMGDRILLEVPHPADRALRFMGATGNAVQGNADPSEIVSALAGAVNPSGQESVRELLKNWRPPGEGTDWAHDVAKSAPPDNSPGPIKFGKAVFGTVFGPPATFARNVSYYANPLPQLIHTELGTRTIKLPNGKTRQIDAGKLRMEIVRVFVYGDRKSGPDFKYGILEARNDAEKLQKAGRDADAAKLTAWANTRYADMQKVLTRFGFDKDPLAPASATAPAMGLGLINPDIRIPAALQFAREIP